MGKLILRERVHQTRPGTVGWAGHAGKAGACVASTGLAAAFLIHMFGTRQILAALSNANVSLLLGALGIGALIQVVRAQRSRFLLAQHRHVSLFHSFAAMVVGHGVGDLVPLAPGGPVLRSVLTERLTGAPIAFSGGAYTVEGMLDVIAPALLIPYILSMPSLPSWTHWLLIGIAIQAMLLLTVLVALTRFSGAPFPHLLKTFTATRLMHLAGQITDGLRAVTAGGRQRCFLVVGLSVLLMTLTAGQLSLFLRAFDLRGSAGGLLLLLVVMLSAGSVPVKIPAFGTISAAAVLPVAGFHGPEAGGYLLVSQFLLSSETAVLAALVLGWWFLRGALPFRGMDRRRSEESSHRFAVLRLLDPQGRGTGHLVEAPVSNACYPSPHSRLEI